MEQVSAHKRVGWVGEKPVNWARVQQLLHMSAEENHWSNFGPVSRRLETFIHESLEIGPERRVVATSSGTSALYAAAAMKEHCIGRPLRWVVSDFGFFCTRQGPFQDAIVLDSDRRGVLSLDALRELNPDSYDGILLTNVFGILGEIDQFIAVAEDNKKALLLDSAGSYGAIRANAIPVDVLEAFSFHHTKPWGFGEGGVLVVPAEDENLARSVVNFGLVANQPVAGVATNGKMSDVSAAFILSWLQDYGLTQQKMRDRWAFLAAVASRVGFSTLGRDDSDPPRGLSCLALVADTEVREERFGELPFVGRKYYRPLVGMAMASSIYTRILNIPVHTGMESISGEALERALDMLMRCCD